MKKTIGIIGIIFIVIVGIAGSFILSSHRKDSNEGSKENVIENNSMNNQEREEDGNNNFGEGEVDFMRIRVSDGANPIIFELNDSDAARSLYEQLPLTIEIENFSSNEKIFYPTKKLDVGNTPRANGGGEGVLAYYEPWGDVVMFYDSFSSASGLYELGVATNGANQIGILSGEITIERLEN